MNQSPFQKVSFIKRSFFQKLFKQYPTDNAIIELNNLLSSKVIKTITPKDIELIEVKYNLSLATEFSLNVQEFYAVYLNHCLKDKMLSNDELDELQHLKKVFSLNDTLIENIHTRIGKVVYKKSFEEAVSDGRLSEDEKRFLDKLEMDLKLPKNLVDKISSETRKSYLDNYINNVVSDQRLSPAEEAEIKAISKSLNIDIQIDDKNKRILDKLKLYWALENLELPTIIADIALQKGEVCYIKKSSVKWYEKRSVRKTVGGGKIKISKGFYLKMQSRTISTSELKVINTGTVYLTNKRLIFMGDEKNSNIKLEKILSITPYSDGFEIDKETGKSPLLKFVGDADVFCIVLERVLSETR